MTKRRFETLFCTLTRLIFTAITAEAAVLLTTVTMPVNSFADAGLYRNLPLCTEHLTAAIVLYLLCAAAATITLRESCT